MPDLKMKIDLGNAAFQNEEGGFEPQHEIARILRRIADATESRGVNQEYGEYMLVYDVNGNKIGYIDIGVD